MLPSLPTLSRYFSSKAQLLSLICRDIKTFSNAAFLSKVEENGHNCVSDIKLVTWGQLPHFSALTTLTQKLTPMHNNVAEQLDISSLCGWWWWLWSCRMGYYRGWQSEGGVQVIVKWQELVNHRNLTNEQPASRHLKNCPPRQALCYLHDVHRVCTHLRWSAPNSLFAKGELVRLAAHTHCHTLHTLSYLAYSHIPINAKHLHIIVCW